MKRIDWHLLRPPKHESQDAHEAVDGILQCLQATNRFGENRETDEALAKIEIRYEELTISPCEASAAPLVGDDPDWETRTIDEFAEVDTDLELEEYLELRRVDSDCERCPYASPYSLYPMAPCEYSAGGLVAVLKSPELAANAAQVMVPEDMYAYANALEAVIKAGQLEEHQGVHAEDYVTKAVLFLRFWAKLGFTVVPVVWPNAETQGKVTLSDENGPAESFRVLH